MKLPLLASILAIACLVFFAACSDRASQSTPPAIATKTRIVALSPAIAIILRDLGHAEQIVGRHAYDYVLPQTIPACGDQSGIDYEALIRVQPTHVFTQWGARQVPDKLRELATQRNWTLLDVNPLTLEQIATSTTALDAALLRNGVASNLASSLAQKVRLLGQPNAIPHPQPPRVLLLVSLMPTTAIGPGSCHHEMLIGAGGVPAITDGLAYQNLTNEDIVRIAPDGIIWFRPKTSPANNPSGESEYDSIDEADPWDRLASLRLRAVEQRQVAVIDDPLALMPSTSMIAVGERMRAILASWNESSPSNPK